MDTRTKKNNSFILIWLKLSKHNRDGFLASLLDTYNRITIFLAFSQKHGSVVALDTIAILNQKYLESKKQLWTGKYIKQTIRL